MTELDIVDNRWGNRTVDEQIRRLFESDGTIYLVTGFFTYNAYHTLRPEIEDFLSRSPENELVVVVGPAADQFSSTIARDLRTLDDGEQVHLYKYPDGFLHAKLYLRIGPNPAVVVGSANLTQVAFEQNLELSASLECDRDGEHVEPFHEWVEALLEHCEPVRRRDLVKPVMLARTVVNWINKGKLLPSRAVLGHRMVHVLVLLVLLQVLFA